MLASSATLLPKGAGWSYEVKWVVRPSRRFTIKRPTPSSTTLFDVLHLDERDLTTTPLDERREVLSTVLKGSRLLRSEPLPGTPDEIERAVRELHLEGVVAKRPRATTPASVAAPG
jgi:ATP-dependent DNA ligase